MALYRGLDYSTDPSPLFALWTSKVHAGLGALIGALLQQGDGTVARGLALVLIVAYSVRNLKHRRMLDERFASVGQPFPGSWRSSMARQQMQLYIGIGAGGLLFGGNVPSELVIATLCVLSVSSLVIGFVQLSLSPIPEAARRAFVARWDPQHFARYR